jgi:MFS family permease
MSAMSNTNRRYEYTVLAIFFFTWGIIFMDRLAISFLLPIIVPKLGLNNTDVGFIGFVTTACFAVSSVVFGALSDKLGYRKKLLLPFIFGTGVFAGLGVVTETFGQLLVVRGLVGFCEGPISPLIYSILFDINKDTFGRNCGIINASVGAIGATFGSVFITQLAMRYTWQDTFLLSSLPTFVMFVLVALFVKEVKVKPEAGTEGQVQQKAAYKDIFKYRNVVLCCLICVLGMAAYWTLMLFSSLYLVNIMHFSVETMGWVTSAMGALYIIYSLLVPKLADNFGRKPVLITGLALSILGPLSMYLFQGNVAAAYMYVLFGGFTAAVIPIFLTMIPMETVPVTLVVTVGSFVQGMGDLFGSAIWPVAAGRIADVAGLPFMMLMAALLLTVTTALSFGLNETRPRKPSSAVAITG